jgi:hypothetical protein
MSGALMRRWLLGIYADHTGRTRREESLRPFSGCAALSFEGRLRLALASLRGPRPASTGTAHAAATWGSGSILDDKGSAVQPSRTRFECEPHRSFWQDVSLRLKRGCGRNSAVHREIKEVWFAKIQWQ